MNHNNNNLEQGVIELKKLQAQICELWVQARKSMHQNSSIEEQLYLTSTVIKASIIFRILLPTHYLHYHIRTKKTNTDIFFCGNNGMGSDINTIKKDV